MAYVRAEDFTVTHRKIERSSKSVSPSRYCISINIYNFDAGEAVMRCLLRGLTDTEDTPQFIVDMIDKLEVKLDSKLRHSLKE